MAKAPELSRRIFILSTAAAAASGSLARAAAVGQTNSGVRALTWPPMTEQNRPWTRYWWMGSAVDTKNLAAELNRYHAAGLGGLEVTPIYGAKGWEDRYIPYLTRRWMEMLDFDIRGAHHLHMGVDMTTGTGWNMGGPDITGAYASLYARQFTINYHISTNKMYPKCCNFHARCPICNIDIAC